MRDGSFATLADVLEHCASAGGTTAGGPLAAVGRQSPPKDTFVRGCVLSPRDRADLLAFLISLTDLGFLTIPDYSDPFAPRR